jgi:predicted ferric reductase
MKKQKVTLKSIKRLNHDVLQIKTTKPKNCNYKPGQAVRISIDKIGWKQEDRPFTFTSLPSDEDLEFIIKVYPSHNGMTKQLFDLTITDEVFLENIYGTIDYQGKGTFIAGGVGLTPFVAILKDLKVKNEVDGHNLLFANKTEKDIFLQDWLKETLGKNYQNILSKEKKDEFDYGQIDKEYLKENITDYSQNFYVCGPPEMSDSVIEDLLELGAKKENIVAENFEA